ncbi:hypothetical protein O6H91_06G062200 [Diphasiastrum complanatum]|nr:hypothetical protein O6H91_06G062200 [Diphasiastrum complanatum]
MLARKQYTEAQFLFEAAAMEGHVYSLLGVARAKCKRGQRLSAYIDITALISAYKPRGWMYQERSLCCDAAQKLADLDKATEMDPTLPYPYKYRAAMLMDKHEGQLAISEINRLLSFKVSADCLELRSLFNLFLEDYKEAMKDIRALLSLKPSYRLFAGHLSAKQLLSFLGQYVPEMSKTDCWRQLQECCSSLDDIGALAVIHKVLESDPGRGSLFFWQALFLLRLNCPKAALHSLHLASKNASSDHERAIYEGWIYHHTNRREDAIWKAEESIESQPTFEAFLLNASSLADATPDPLSLKRVVGLLKEALKYPSHGLRKGQALNHLGNILLDSGHIERAAECYRNAIALGHTLAHQGLAEVYSSQGQRKLAHQEMTKLIQKAKNKASAYEKRSEYSEVEEAINDLNHATKLNPLRPFPYKFRAAVLMDKERHSEAIEELSKALSFKPDAQLLHLRATFSKFLGDESRSLQDCCAALSLDSNHADTLRLYAHLRSPQVH